MALPACFAVIVQIPTAFPMIVFPVIEHMVSGAAVNATGRVELAEAEIIPVLPLVMIGVAVNVMVCVFLMILVGAAVVNTFPFI